MTLRKLKQSEIAAWRAQQRLDQNGICPISGWGLDATGIAADHCHKTGMMRATLPTWVNAQLGRIENAANRVGGGTYAPDFLRKCADYIEYHSRHPSFVLHPTFKTPDEKKEAAKKRAAATRKKKAAERAANAA